MMSFLESFQQMNEEHDDTVDPTNVPIERFLRVLKYAEKSLLNLQFGLLAQHTMAEFNKVLAHPPSIEPAKSHSQITEIEKRMKQDHLKQHANLLASAQRVHDEVL